MKKRFDGLVAIMPFAQIGMTQWDWLGARLAGALHDKLLVAGLVGVPFYELGQLDPAPEAELLTNWEAHIQLAEFLEGGYILTGSYLFEERRVKINAYIVQASGFSLIAQFDETKEDYMQILSYVCQQIAAAFGKPTNARVRERIQRTSPTSDRAAFEAAAMAMGAWADTDLTGVHKAVEKAQELDPDYLEPLDILSHATRELGSAEEMETALRTELMQLVASPSYYKSLYLVEGWLDSLQRAGETRLAAECLKARSAIQGGVGDEGIAGIYARRAQEVNDQLVAMLDQDEANRLAILGAHGWSTGQVVALALLAKGWLGQAQVADQVGQRALARVNGQRAEALYRLMGDNKKRQQAHELVTS